MAVTAYRHAKAADIATRATGDNVRFRCDTQAELPSANVQDGDSAYAINTKKLFDRVGGAWVEVGDSSNTGGGGSSVPAGCILMWTGLLSAIPSGWVLCDGANGTPDLRSKFIKGAAAAAEAGGTGGSATHTHADHAALTHAGTAVTDHASHTHSYSEIVNHTHPVTDPGHTHTQDAHTHTQNSHNHTQDAHSHIITSQTATTGGATSYEHGVLDTSSAEAEATETTATTVATNQAATATNQNATATNQSNTTGITTSNPVGGVASGTTAGPSATLSHSVTQPNNHAAQAHDTVNSEPAFFTVLFIMKT